MGRENKSRLARLKRQGRVRNKILGTNERPRLSVFRSARHIYAQIIDDDQGRTLAACSSVEKKFSRLDKPESKCHAANMVGKLIAQLAKEKGITKVVFDRNGFLYHGRVKAVSDGAREAGLEF
ncbi:MAG: 50S ribosomal protein L18 [Deltaproteobacteria bacterium]|nr:50S ribosomal protein L18 [Deltaproteobacteria bacterium]